MRDQDKDDLGRFAKKSNSERIVRSIRATNETWSLLGDKAEENDMTRADFLEALVNEEVVWNEEKNVESEVDFDVDEVAEILKEALTLKSNAGGKIKAKIKEALALMNIELEDID